MENFKCYSASWKCHCSPYQCHQPPKKTYSKGNKLWLLGFAAVLMFPCHFPGYLLLLRPFQSHPNCILVRINPLRCAIDTVPLAWKAVRRIPLSACWQVFLWFAFMSSTLVWLTQACSFISGAIMLCVAPGWSHENTKSQSRILHWCSRRMWSQVWMIVPAATHFCENALTMLHTFA